MRELIETVKAEAEKVIHETHEDDQYHKNHLQENENKREVARTRIRACDDALDALNSAAQHLSGKKVT